MLTLGVVFGSVVVLVGMVTMVRGGFVNWIVGNDIINTGCSIVGACLEAIANASSN